MRVAIREQLATLVILAVSAALAVVSIPTWIFVNRFVGQVESTGLALTASLKAAWISSEIDLIQTSCLNIASRILIQRAFSSFYLGNHSESNWDSAEEDMQSALSAAGFSNLYQARLYSRNSSGQATGLLNVTGLGIGPVDLPYNYANGTQVMLGDLNYGYPPMLYPNITYNDTGIPNRIDNTTNAFTASAFPGVYLTNQGGLLLGPLVINSSFALISLTVPVRQTDNQFILGYMTLVASASNLIGIQESREGLGNTGMVLFIGPSTQWNRFNGSYPASNQTYIPPDRDDFGDVEMHFVLPPLEAPKGPDRHTQHDFGSGTYAHTFKLSSYPAALELFSSQIDTINNASSILSTKNEQGYDVAVGYARPQSSLVNWAVIVEQNRSEAYSPVHTLRQILLGCVFGTLGLVLIIVFPSAHLSVRPIRELKYATEKSIAPPGYGDDDEQPSSGTRSSRSKLSEKDWMIRLRRMVGMDKKSSAEAQEQEINLEDTEGGSHTVFKIPKKVPDRKHIITDELTELTTTFNAMSDELFKQYESLDEKVAERTRELEISKKAAEAANESKTLFIANISHELKTPLNGIMGMCAVCMEEDDLGRVKQSLKTLYKSGDLLLHLLEDLLSFSKNQIGHQVSLEEREFRLGDIRSQVLAIFDKQVREGNIKFSVTHISSDTATTIDATDGAIAGSDNLSPTATVSQPGNTAPTALDPRLQGFGPAGVGRIKNMCLWGDQQRILQVIINLVSNSLKFTPRGGEVSLRIRCIGEIEQGADDSRTSSLSKAGSHRGRGTRTRIGSASTQSVASKNGVNLATTSSISTGAGTTTYKGTATGTALAINPLDPRTNVGGYVRFRERSPTPPPPGAKTYLFEFEVQDTGPGIAPHMQAKVFEPFVQGDLGLSKKFGGTGLGLSICQQLAALMGGTITLTSAVDVGTTFTMRIPLKYVKDRASSAASSSLASRPVSASSNDVGDSRRNSYPKASSDSSKPKQQGPVLNKQARLVGLSQPFFVANRPDQTKEAQMAALDRAVANKSDGQMRVRVLVADDNSTNIEVVSRMLKLEDIYDVTIAKDGQEAYEQVKANMEKNQMFDVIFMDIQMPNLDGLQSTRLIRKMGYSAPIVALTAFSEDSNIQECLDSGMNEFLSKPIRRPALKQVLQRFATIPEEPETASITRPTPEKTTPAQTPDAVNQPVSEYPGMVPTSTANATDDTPNATATSSDTVVADASTSPGVVSTGSEPEPPNSPSTMVNGSSNSNSPTGAAECNGNLPNGGSPPPAKADP